MTIEYSLSPDLGEERNYKDTHPLTDSRGRGITKKTFCGDGSDDSTGVVVMTSLFFSSATLILPTVRGKEVRRMGRLTRVDRWDKSGKVSKSSSGPVNLT